MKRRLLLLLLTGATLGCGELRSKDQDMVRLPALTYVDDVEPLVAEKCVSCHGGDTTEGNYDLSNWRGLSRRGSDETPNAVPGDSQSKLLTVLADETHSALLDAAQVDLLTRWVVNEGMAYFSVGATNVHPPGWMLPHDRGARTFHGGLLRANRWDMRQCQVCHGKTFEGQGEAGACSKCHQDGPTGCSTCHGDGNSGTARPPSDLMGSFSISERGVGLHATHESAPCEACHVLPSPFFYDKGHLFDDDQRNSDLRAELSFGAIARGKTIDPGIDLQPGYDPATMACSNVYCHSLDGAQVTTWTWTKPLDEIKVDGKLPCDSCHGSPPTKTLTNKAHPAVAICENCHIKAYKDGQLDPTTHINGKVEVF